MAAAAAVVEAFSGANAVSETPNGELQIAFWEEGHRYVIRKGDECKAVPSVTTVKAEPVLSWWGQRVGTKAVLTLYNTGMLFPVEVNIGNRSQRVLGFDNNGVPTVAGEEQIEELIKKHHLDVNHVRDTAGERGQAAHDALEVWALSGACPDVAMFPPSEQPYVYALRNFLETAQVKPVRSEVLVASWKYGYSGRFDLDVEIEKPTRLLAHYTPSGLPRYERYITLQPGLHRWDLKTSKDVYDEHGEQLEAYEEAAVEDGYPASIGRGVLHISGEGKWKFVPTSQWAQFSDFKLTLDKWHANQARTLRERAARKGWEK